MGKSSEESLEPSSRKSRAQSPWSLLFYMLRVPAKKKTWRHTFFKVNSFQNEAFLIFCSAVFINCIRLRWSIPLNDLRQLMFSKEFWSSLRSPYCKLWCRNVHQVCVQEGNYRGFNQDFPIEVFTSALYSRKRRHGSFLVLLSFFGHISVVYTFVLTSSVEYGVQNTHEFSRFFFTFWGNASAPGK